MPCFKHNRCLLAGAVACLFAAPASAGHTEVVSRSSRQLASAGGHDDEDAAAFAQVLGDEAPLEHILELHEETSPATDIVDWLFDAIRCALPLRDLCAPW